MRILSHCKSIEEHQAFILRKRFPEVLAQDKDDDLIFRTVNGSKKVFAINLLTGTRRAVISGYEDRNAHK